MRRALPTPLLLALVLTVGGQAHAQPATAPVAEPEKTSPVPPAPPNPPPRAVSPETAAKLAAVAPKFVPPTPAEEKPAADLRDTDKPKNGIIRLPAYLVREPKMRELKQRELLTPKGKLDLALKRHPGLRFNPLFFLGSNDGIARAMLEEEDRLERLAEMADLLSLMRYSDTPMDPDTKRNVQQSFIRPSDFGWQGGSPR